MSNIKYVFYKKKRKLNKYIYIENLIYPKKDGYNLVFNVIILLQELKCLIFTKLIINTLYFGNYTFICVLNVKGSYNIIKKNMKYFLIVIKNIFLKIILNYMN